MKIKAILGTLAATAVFGSFAADSAKACTNVIVTKGASADGSCMISYAADSHWLYGELYFKPQADWKRGDKLRVSDWDTGQYLGLIDQVEHTYKTVGNMNEHQLIIAETTFGGRHGLNDPNGIMDYGSLIYIALQRARTAREAIKVMTGLTDKYGYFSEGESFSIADKNEAWIMEMVGKGTSEKGAVWVAVRIPDGYISCHANQSRITTFPLNDPENCIYAPDVIDFARKQGWYIGPDSEFSFRDAYCPADFGALRGCEARVWSAFNILSNGWFTFDDGNGNMITKDAYAYVDYAMGHNPENRMPLWIKPAKKVTVKNVADVMRDHYEGTPLDISKDFGAGPYHTPYRLSPLSFKVNGQEYFNERPISTQQSGFVFVSQMRSTMPDAIGGVLWFGTDDANMTVFTPVYCCTDKVPVCYSRVDGADYITFSWNSSFWIFNWVANMVYPRYDLMIGDVRASQSEMETTFNDAQEGIESAASKLYSKDPARAKEFLTNYTNMTAQSTLDTWKRLGEFLIVKYNDGVVKRMKDGKFERNSIGQPAGVIRPGYPKEFLEEYVKQTGDRYKMPE